MTMAPTWTDLISLEDLKGEAGDAAATPTFSVGRRRPYLRTIW